MLQNMAMPHIFATTYIERERLTLMVADLHAGDCYVACWRSNNIHKQFLIRQWRKYRWSSIRPDINLFRNSWNTTNLWHTIECLPVSLVFRTVKSKPAYNLKINQMNMDGMIIHGQIYQIEIIDLPLFVYWASAAHFKWHAVNHGTWDLILAI